MKDNPINNNSIHNSEDEIYLRNILKILWKGKIKIVSFIIIFTLIAGLYSRFIISPIYLTKLNIIVNMPDTFTTQFGEFKLPITTNDQYINLIKSNEVIQNTIKDMEYAREVTVEGLKEKITINIASNASKDQNNFSITVSGKTPEESLKLAQSLYYNYIGFLNSMLYERAITFFNNEFKVQIESAKMLLATKEAELKRNKELLKEIPQTINQKAAMEATKVTASDFIVLEDIINPNYTSLQNTIMLNQQDINRAQITISDYTRYLDELIDVKTDLDKYNETRDLSYIINGVFDIVSLNIYLPSDPVAPSRKESPSNMKNAILGGIAGGGIGIFGILLAAYIRKEL